jgi:DNA-binding CsgD family transcriptional regulator
VSVQKPPDGFRLSAREHEIVALAAQGKSDKEISQLLEISVGTLGTYWARIRNKLGLRWRTEIVAHFVRWEHAAGQSGAGDRPELAALLDALGLSLTEFDGEGRVTYGNAAYKACLAELGLPDPLPAPLEGFLQFDSGGTLLDRLRAGKEFSSLVSIVVEGKVLKRSFLRAWPHPGDSGRWVAAWEILGEKAAVMTTAEPMERPEPTA